MPAQDLSERIITAGGYAPATSNAMLKAAPTPRHRYMIATTNVLDHSTWCSLYAANPKITPELATALVSSTLSTAQIDHVLATECRARPLAALIVHNTLTPAHLDGLRAAKLVTPQVAIALVNATWLDADTKRALAATHPKVHAAWLRTATDLSDTEIISGIVALSHQLSPTATHDLALETLERRPHLLAAFISHRCPDLPIAAAASRHLTCLNDQRTLAGLDYPAVPRWLRTHSRRLNKLVRNPHTSAQVCAELAARTANDPQMGSIAAAYALRSTYQVDVTQDYATLTEQAAIDLVLATGNIWDKARLAANPALKPYQLTMIGLALLRSHVRSPLLATNSEPAPEPPLPRTIADPPGWRMADLPNRASDLTLLARYTETQLGTDAAAWQLFMALADDFPGTLGSMLELCTKLG